MVRAGVVHYRSWRDGHVVYHDWAWTSDASGNVIFNMEIPIRGIPWRLVTKPRDDAPTANYDVTLLDGDGADAFLGKGGDRSDTLTQMVFINDVTGAESRTLMAGRYRFTVTGAGAAKSGAVTLSVVDFMADSQLPRI